MKHVTRQILFDYKDLMPVFGARLRQLRLFILGMMPRGGLLGLPQIIVAAIAENPRRQRINAY